MSSKTTESVSENAESSNNYHRHKDLFSIALVVIGGILSGLATHILFGFSSINGIVPILPASLLVLVVLKYAFNDITKEKIAYVIFMILAIWFISGVFFLQI